MDEPQSYGIMISAYSQFIFDSETVQKVNIQLAKLTIIWEDF